LRQQPIESAQPPIGYEIETGRRPPAHCYSMTPSSGLEAVA
jgi:hypothetical protein